VTGNIARMEGLLIFLITAGFLLIQKQRSCLGLGLILLSPLVHPNGLYFCASAAVYFGFSRKHRLNIRNFSLSDRLCLLLVLVLWIIYGLYVMIHWHAFLSDMSYQFNLKGARNIMGTLLIRNNLFAVLLVLICIIFYLKTKTPVIYLLTIGIPAWFIYRIGREMWYEVYDCIFYLLVSVILYHVVYGILQELVFLKKQVLLQQIIIVIVISGLLLCVYHTGMIENPLGIKYNRSWWGMGFPGEIPLIAKTDLEKIRDFLNSLHNGGRLVRIQYYPRAEALFFHDLDGKKIRFWDPVKPHHVQPDIFMFHMSRHLPKWWKNRNINELHRAGIKPTDITNVFHKRNNSEIWFYKITNVLIE